MNRYTVAVLVRNQFGVLNRVTSMFRRRQFNISSLTVSETEVPEYSRITVLFDGAEMQKQQLISQLYKLPDVCFVRELSPKASVSLELMLIKLELSQSVRDTVLAIAREFDAKVVDSTEASVILQVTADSRQLDAVIDRMREFSILEICRTGCVSLEKGSTTIREIMNQ
ncbi:MAG: acetolactate synthase small subunit [Clostridia bacterium]|nr:acetolactate synthase small subunit [Clostridia bacterium]